MADLTTPMGVIQAAPASTDDRTVILWVVGILVVSLGIALWKLWRFIEDSGDRCRAEAKESQTRIDDLHAQIGTMYQEAIKATAEREAKMVDVVNGNTQALRDLAKEIGSGTYRALREKGPG